MTVERDMALNMNKPELIPLPLAHIKRRKRVNNSGRREKVTGQQRAWVIILVPGGMDELHVEGNAWIENNNIQKETQFNNRYPTKKTEMLEGELASRLSTEGEL